MPRAHAPLLTATPTRFAGLSRQRARIALALVAVLVLACMVLMVHSVPAPPAGTTDFDLYRSIVAGVRHGGNYYETSAAALRSANDPLRPFLVFRLPTLAVAEGSLPPFATAFLLLCLAIGTMAAWLGRLQHAFPRTGALASALVLLVGGMAAFPRPELAVYHEIWAGLLIALALARRRAVRWVEPAALGLIAMLVHETALPFVLIMAVLALRDGERREAAGWTATVVIFAIVFALHAHAVAGVVRPGDAAAASWHTLPGLGFFLQSWASATALTMLPAIVAAPVLMLTLLGWAGWREPCADRMLAMLIGYALLIALFAPPACFHWALMIAPASLIGLAAAPDAMRDLVAAALDRRRITVTRIVR